MGDSIPEHDALLHDLREAGFVLDSLDDWVNGPTPRAAQDILVIHLEKAMDERVIESIARALTQKDFRGLERPLLKKFVQVRGDGVRWAIANALVYLGFSRQSWDEILRLAADTSYGGGRQNLVKRLHRIKSPAVEPTLLSLLDDPDVDAFAASSLGRRGGQRALAKLQSLDLSGRSVLTKREVPKAIERLRRRLDAA